MNDFIKIKNIIINILCIIYIINTFIHLFLYKFVYGIYIDFGRFNSDSIEKIIDSAFIFFVLLFIIIIIDIIIDLWINKKFKVKILSCIVICIFVLLNVFSAPFGYLSDHNEDTYNTYKLDSLLTIMDFSANEGDFSGGGKIQKYIYIPFTNKLILIDGFKFKVEELNESKYYVVNYYYNES